MTSKYNLADIDPAMAVKPANTDGLSWHLPYESPIQLHGFAWFDQDGKYDRLPQDRPETVTQYPGGVETKVPGTQCGAYLLSSNTAGGQIRFKTDSSRFLVHAVVTEKDLMDHITRDGQAGFDLYLKINGTWRHFGTSRIQVSAMEYTVAFCPPLKREMREVLIHFPMYSPVTTVSIGLDDDSKLSSPAPFEDDSPIVFYGTSITQGGCCSRPGMASSNILSRILNREVINLGFSGSGRGEPELARMLADIPNPYLYLIDYAWNTNPDECAVTLPQLLDILREKHPTTPIVLVSPTPGIMSYQELVEPHPLFNIGPMMEAETAKRHAGGDAGIYFYDAFHLALGDDFWECLVDGCHMTDMGFYRFAHNLADWLKTNVLQPSGH